MNVLLLYIRSCRVQFFNEVFNRSDLSRFTALQVHAHTEYYSSIGLTNVLISSLIALLCIMSQSFMRPLAGLCVDNCAFRMGSRGKAAARRCVCVRV